MPLAQVLTVTLGGAVVRAIVKHWVGEASLLADLTADASTLLGEAGLDFFERRRISRELEEVSERIAERLQPFFEAEQFGGLASNEREAAAYAVAATVQQGFTDAHVALEADLDAGRLERRLRDLSPRAAQKELLSDLAVRLYDIALAETCAYLVAMVENLPRFAGTAFAELLSRDRAILEKLDAALEHLPTTNTEQALSFETRYMREVARQLDQLRLFGFTTSSDVRRYQLSVAYISLSVAMDDGEGLGDGIETNAGDDDPEEDAHAVPDVELGEPGNGRRPSSSDDGDDEAHAIRVDQAVRAAPRLLVRGDAGSGKSTLLSWLAVNAARRSFDASLNELAGLVPVFLPLRRYADEDLPAPGAFVDSVASAIRGFMPSDFVERILDTGRGLVLVDGVDELAADRRDDAREWLEDLTSAYPGSRFVVTSRPPAVDEDWLADIGFDACMLEPMNLGDLDSFIDHWHDAIEVGRDEAARETLKSEARQLKATIRRQAPLRRLATSPLLAAMLCALHHDGSAQLPRDRIQLYDRALEALLERRDADRRVGMANGLKLREKRELLRELAYWFLRNGYSDAARDQVVEQLSRSLTRLRVERDAADVYKLLLERTGLLREPDVAHVDFIHRTFLEYLAAQAIVEHDDLGYLVAQAHSDAFNEVVVLAAGVGNALQRRQLISGLLERADEGDPASKRLQLLAVACLETVTTLDHELTERVQRVLEDLVPPESLTAAKEFAAAGDLAVDLLAPRPDRPLLAVEARACVRALGVIGTEHSLDQLVKYGSDGRMTVVRELLRQWGNFDRLEYARRVLADSPLLYGHFSVRGREALEVIPYLNKLRHLTVTSDETGLPLWIITGHENLESLTLQRLELEMSLLDIVPLQSLKSLTLTGLRDLQTLMGVERLASLATLIIQGSPALMDLEPLRGHPSLSKLAVSGPEALNIAAVAGLQLRNLELRIAYIDGLEAVAELPELEHVSFDGVSGDLELFPLISTNRLHTLAISDCDGEVSPVLLGRDDSPLASLTIHSVPSLGGRIHEFGRTQELSVLVEDLAALEDLTPLGCRILSVAAQRGDAVPRAAGARDVELRLEALTQLTELPSRDIKSLFLKCPQLERLDALRDAHKLERLYLSEVGDHVDLTALKQLPDQCTVFARPTLYSAIRDIGVHAVTPVSQQHMWRKTARPLPFRRILRFR